MESEKLEVGIVGSLTNLTHSEAPWTDKRPKEFGRILFFVFSAVARRRQLLPKDSRLQAQKEETAFREVNPVFLQTLDALSSCCKSWLLSVF